MAKLLNVLGPPLCPPPDPLQDAATQAALAAAYIPMVTCYPASWVEDEVKKYSLYMVIVAVATFTSGFVNKWAFGNLGQNVTLGIRNFLYNNILQKHMGFFDDRANATGVLTSAMAKDTSVINGVSAESLGPVVESVCALAAGVGIGFYYCW